MIALLSIFSFASFYVLGIPSDFGDWIISTRMERMALHESLGGKHGPFPYPETLNRYGSIVRTGRVKTAARSKKDGESVLIEMDQSDERPL